MTALIWIIIFIVSMYVLIKSADYFTNAAEKIGISFGIAPFIVGVTIVSVGTSLPELVTSILAVIKGSSEIVVGNVIGSNIANIFLVLAIVAIISKKIRITHAILSIDLPLLVGSGFLLAITIWDGVFTLPEAIFCLVGFLIYILYAVNVEKYHTHEEIKQVIDEKVGTRKLDWKLFAILIVSSFFIYVGAKYIVESVINLSQLFNIGTEIIAVSAVALGTSLPEVAVSVLAAKKGNAEMAIGNILGSNIFNSLAVMGISAFFGTLIIPQNMLSFSLPMMLLATLLYFFIIQDKEITRWEGLFLLLFYVLFIGKLFNIV